MSDDAIGVEKHHQKSSINIMRLILRVMSEKITWVFLFLSAYSIPVSLSWTFLKSVLFTSGWLALHVSLFVGVCFGVVFMVAVPSILVTGITALVVLALCGEPRKTQLIEAKKLTAQIAGSVVRVLMREAKAQVFATLNLQSSGVPPQPTHDH